MKTYKLTRTVWKEELPTTEVIVETETKEEAVEMKKFYDELYRREIISVEFPE